MNSSLLPSPSQDIPIGSSPPGLDHQAILQSVEKLCASSVFRNADGQIALLRYVVDQSLRGCGDQIKEYTIGQDVFHRRDSFDPRQDNIVRAKARKLRLSLAKYYETEGSADAVRIELPVGAYKPSFQFRETSAAVAAPAVNGHQAVPTAPLGNESHDEDPVQEMPAAAAKSSPSWRLAVTLVAVGLAISSAWFLFRPGRQNKGSGVRIPSVAVLPFRVLNYEKQEEFLSDGLTEDLTDSLAQIPGLRVVASGSALQYKGKSIDIREVGRKLNAGAVLQGSVRKYEDHVRITAQLTDAATGFDIWSASYDREVDNLLAIQREIASAISGALGLKLAGPTSSGESSALAPGSVAYEDYLKGRYFLNKGSLKNLEKAITYFGSAIEKDPAYAPSYAGLAHAYAGIPPFESATSQDILVRIRENASRALMLDSSLGEAHVALGSAYSFEYEWQRAEAEFRKALELSPGVAGVHEAYSRHLGKVGRYQESLAEGEKARNLDPLSVGASITAARPYYYMHRYDQALSQFQKAYELDPNSATLHEYMGLAYFMKGDHAKGIAEIGISRDMVKDNIWYAGLMSYVSGIDGKRDAANQILDELLQRAAKDPAPAMAIAHCYIGLGNKDEAFKWLSKAIDQRNPIAFLLKDDPMFDSLRKDPRFTALLHRIRLD